MSRRRNADMCSAKPGQIMPAPQICSSRAVAARAAPRAVAVPRTARPALAAQQLPDDGPRGRRRQALPQLFALQRNRRASRNSSAVADFSDVRLFHAEHMALMNRPETRGGRGLVSLCNHASTLDDPALWGMLRLSTLASKHNRWCVACPSRVGHVTCAGRTLAADNICFTRPHHAWFFAHGQGIPVHRGAGVNQPV